MALNFNGMRPPATLNVVKVGNGVVTSTDGQIDCGENCSTEHNRNSETTLSATPAEGWIFEGWSGDVPQECDGQTGDCTVVMDEDKTVTATFVEEEEEEISLNFPDPFICIEHGTDQSEILWLWAFSEALGFQFKVTMLITLPNDEEVEIEVTSSANASKILMFLNIFTFGNYEWEITNVMLEGNEIPFTGTTSGTVEVDADEQNAGECS